MVSTSEVEGLGDSGTVLLCVYMQMFLFIYFCCSYNESICIVIIIQVYFITLRL